MGSDTTLEPVSGGLKGSFRGGVSRNKKPLGQDEPAVREPRLPPGRGNVCAQDVLAMGPAQAKSDGTLTILHEAFNRPNSCRALHDRPVLRLYTNRTMANAKRHGVGSLFDIAQVAE